MNTRRDALAAIRRQNLLSLLESAESDREFAKQVDLAPAYISQLKLGTRNIGNKVARKIEAAVGKKEGWFDQAPSNAFVTDRRMVAYSNAEELGEGYAHIPLVDINVGAGSQGFAENPRTRMDLAFISGWLTSQGLEPQDLKLIEVLGDFMEPRIHEGDMVLIDTAQRTPRSGGVYAVMSDGWLKIKRLHVSLTGEIELVSDNPKYAPERPDSQLVIIGRCIWLAGSGGL